MPIFIIIIFVVEQENNITSVVNDVDIYETPIDGGFDYEEMDEKEFETDSLKLKAQPLKAADSSTTVPVKVNFYSPGPGSSALDNNNYECPVQTIARVSRSNLRE